MKYNII